MAETTVTDLRKFIFENYQSHAYKNEINIESLMSALCKKFGGNPKPQLKEFIIDVCLDIQELSNR